MTIKSVSRLYHTIKSLKFKQVFFRVYYKFKKPRVSSVVPHTLEKNSWQWTGPALKEQTLFDNNEVVFLSMSCCINSKKCWNDGSKSKLWLYNLHYFDDLDSENYFDREKQHIALIDRWIEENPACYGNGWEPYPTSLRLVNWVKWFSKQKKVEEKYLSSVFFQTKTLLQQLEYHILGNHLFANAKALVFVGAYFKGKFSEECLNEGLRILNLEIDEQFLDDGGHFELSPMYHCILLWDLLELIGLVEDSQNLSLKKHFPKWKAVAEKALNWLQGMIHKDGDVSLFNDAAIGIANRPSDVFKYAKHLGLCWSQPQIPLQTYTASGYSSITFDTYSFIFDHAQVGPDYLPGHAHADTLSIELSLGSDRVFVNSGTSLYGVSEERLRQRQTAAHNTVEVCGQSSSEVWSGFRVARRAKASLTSSSADSDVVKLVASHDGYKRLRPKVTHQRAIEATSGFCQIEDTLSEQVEAVFHLHIHPSVNINKVNAKTVELITPSKRTITFTSELDIKLMPSTYHPNFGVNISSTKIVIPFSNGQLVTRMDF